MRFWAPNSRASGCRSNGASTRRENVNRRSFGQSGCGDLPAGVYVGVIDGSAEVTNLADRILIAAGQYSLLSRPTSNPGLVFTSPQVLAGPGAKEMGQTAHAVCPSNNKSAARRGGFIL